MIPYNKNLHENAKALRKNMTNEEKHFWYNLLRKLPFPVKRQKCIENYIVDFYIPSKKIVIEIDGFQHGFLENKEADQLRDLNLQKWGIKVIRYKNDDIRNNFNNVCKDLLNKLNLSFEDFNINLPLRGEGDHEVVEE